MRSVRVLNANSRSRFATLGALFFIQWMAYAAWMVPLTLVLRAHDLTVIQSYAFATSALAAFVSPLFFGAMADRHVAPTQVLRWLSAAAAGATALASFAISQQWNAWVVLGIIQGLALCSSPTVSIASAIALAAMPDPRHQFGPIRAMGTIGWIVGCWLISGLGADTSTLALFSSAALWLSLSVFTFFVPSAPPPASTEHLTWRERLGLDALALLKNPDHRVVFLTTALLIVPLAAFYPFTPIHLQSLGFAHPAAWISLGQTTEILAMFVLGGLLARWRLKWVLAIGLFSAVLRYVFCALDERLWLLIGITLHGFTYTFVYTTAQIYVNERMGAEWRGRAQALLSLFTAGFGNLLGYLGTGWWFAICTQDGKTSWPMFWSGLTAVIFGVCLYFMVSYHGRAGKRPG